jgi:TonB family protein
MSVLYKSSVINTLLIAFAVGLTIVATPALALACENRAASIIASVEPAYSAAAREAGAVGTATVNVLLDANGNVTDAVVQKSAGNADLDQAALLAARTSTYRPEIRNCAKSSGSYLFEADFTGEDPDVLPTPGKTATPLAWIVWKPDYLRNRKLEAPICVEFTSGSLQNQDMTPYGGFTDEPFAVLRKDCV